MTDATTYMMLAGGVLGAGLRVLMTQDQTTFSRKSIVDVVIGGLVGILYPIYPIVDLPKSATGLQDAALVALVGYFSGDLIQAVMGRIGIGKNGTSK